MSADPRPEPSPILLRLCAEACLGLALALPVAVAAGWLMMDRPPLWPLETAPPQPLRIAGALVALVPVLMLSRGLVLARACLARFATGDYFAREAIAGVRGFAAWTFRAALAGLVAPTLLSVILTYGAGPGRRMLSISVGSEQVLGVLVAGILWIMAGVLAHAAAIAEENRQFV